VDPRATGPTMNAVSVGDQTFSEAVPQTGKLEVIGDESLR